MPLFTLPTTLQQREAELAIQIGYWPRVEKSYGDAMRLNPEYYAPCTLLARFYEQVGEIEEALLSYGEALALNAIDEELNREFDQLEAKVQTR